MFNFYSLLRFRSIRADQSIKLHFKHFKLFSILFLRNPHFFAQMHRILASSSSSSQWIITRFYSSHMKLFMATRSLFDLFQRLVYDVNLMVNFSDWITTHHRQQCSRATGCSGFVGYFASLWNWKIIIEFNFSLDSRRSGWNLQLTSHSYHRFVCRILFQSSNFHRSSGTSTSHRGSVDDGYVRALQCRCWSSQRSCFRWISVSFDTFGWNWAEIGVAKVSKLPHHCLSSHRDNLRFSPVARGFYLKIGKSQEEKIEYEKTFEFNLIRLTLKAVISSCHFQIGSISFSKTSRSHDFRVSERCSYRSWWLYDTWIWKWLNQLSVEEDSGFVRFGSLTVSHLSIAVGCSHIIEWWTDALVSALALVKNREKWNHKYVKQHFRIHQVFQVLPTRIEFWKM